MASLTALRSVLAARGLTALVVPSGDPHLSEYVPDAFKRRAFISGFTGSAGTAVITEDEALLWTDGRYHLQAEQQLSDDWTLMKDGLPETPEIQAWLAAELDEGAKVAINASVFSIGDARKYEDALVAAGMELVCLADDEDPVDAVWEDDSGEWETRPPLPRNPVMVLDVEFAGKTREDKIADVRQAMEEKEADAVIISALDEVAWLLNMRGSDIAYNPVFLAFVVITRRTVELFVDASKVDHIADGALEGITIRMYSSIYSRAHVLGVSGERTWLCPASANRAMLNAIEDASAVLEEPSPIRLPKAVKNEAELRGMRQAHIVDALALVKFFSWLEDAVAAGGAADLNEVSVASKLEGFRREDPSCVGLSFATISSVGPNGAIIHYKPEDGSCADIDPSGMYLCDSGGQYSNGGTTDVTRTVHFGTPSAHERACYTRVLQGYIALETAVFPPGTKGYRLDALARVPLWKAGLDYLHGTGHGVGSFLNVHEGPHGISYRVRAHDAGLEQGMTVTDEPGYYEDGAFGIRIENVLVVVEAETEHTFGGAPFLTFEPITLCPLARNLIDTALLTHDELAWVDDYHERVWRVLEPLVAEGRPREWLFANTMPLEQQA